jgi:hypothetical protein
MLGVGKIGTLGTITGSSAAAPFVSTNSLRFNDDALTEYVSRADAAAHDLTTQLTVSAWVKGTGVGGYGGIVCKGDYGASDIAYYCTDSGAVSGKLGVVISNTGGTDKFWSTGTTVFDNTWHHICFTFNAGTLVIYVDRVVDATPTKHADAAVASLKNSGAGLRMGSLINSGTPANFFVGRINNVSIWSVAFTQGEVTALASGGKPVDLSLHSQYANCVSWYKAGDGDTIGASGIIDTKSALHLSPTNMESADLVVDAP